MAKALPYFKFYCSEWNDGDITLEDFETQGVFINICSLYWSRECKLSKKVLHRKFPNNLKNILTLQEEGILVIDSEDLVIIRFLNQQYREKDRRSSTSAVNGAKGGRPKKPNKPNSEPNGKPSEPNSEPNETQLREDKKREDKIIEDNKSKPKKFTPPTIEEVKSYCTERKNSINAEKFINHYEVSGWMRGKNKIKCWKSCVRTWEGNQQDKPQARSIEDLM